MPEDNRMRRILFLVISLVVCLLFLVNAGFHISRLNNSLKKEKQVRLNLEEKIDSLSSEKEALTQEKNALEDKVKSLAEASEQVRQAHYLTKESLLNLEALNKDWDEKLQKANILREILENELKEALLQKKDSREKRKR